MTKIPILAITIILIAGIITPTAFASTSTGYDGDEEDANRYITTLEVGIDTYRAQGAIVTDNNPAYSGTVIIEGAVNTEIIGTYIIIYSAPADASGNLPEQVIRTVNVVDTTPPVITLNGSDIITLEVGIDEYTELGAIVTDNDPAYSGTVIIGGDTVDTNTVGTYIIIYSAPADASGNLPEQVIRTVNVIKLLNGGGNVSFNSKLSSSDTTEPVITAPDDVTLEAPAADTTPANTGTASATDTVDPSVAITFSDVTLLDSQGLGTITRTWTATDASGNFVSAPPQTITIQDTTASVITAPDDVTLEAPAADTTPANTGTASATDTVDPSVAITFSDVTLLDSQGLGTITRTWTATDASGNFVSAPPQTITIQDTTASVITAPDDVTLEAPAADTTPANTGTASATDTVDPSVAITFSDVTLLDSQGLGTITRTWTATDASGNFVSAPPQTITIQDTTASVITAPDDVTLEAPAADTTPANTGTASATDTVDPSVAITFSDVTLLDSQGLGTITRTWTATDASGNFVSAPPQTITIQDTTASVILLNGSNIITLEVDIDTYIEQGATAIDIVDGDVLVIIGGDTVDTNTVGTYIIIYSAPADASGNLPEQVIRTVNVVDTINIILDPSINQIPEQTIQRTVINDSITNIDKLFQVTDQIMCNVDSMINHPITVPPEIAATLPISELLPRANNLSESGQFAESLFFYYIASQIQPNNPHVWNGIGYSQTFVCNNDSAILAYQNTLNQDPQNINAYNGLGFFYEHKAQSDTFPIVLAQQAESFYNQALEIDSNHINSINGIGNVLVLQENYDGAIQMYQKSLDINDKLITTLNGMASAQLRAENGYQAISFYNKVLEIDESNFDALSGLFTIYTLEKQDELALEIAGKLSQYNKQVAENLVQEGLWLQQNGQEEEAQRLFQAALNWDHANQHAKDLIK